MIDNNIIQSLGAGSGIDTRSLVEQLVEVERAAPQQRIDSKTELAETRISDFGLLSSALSTLRDAANILTDPESLFSKTASFTESDALVPLELDTDVQPGSYSFNVSQIAKSHTLAFDGFSDPTDQVGEGTLSFNFGSWDRSGLPSSAPSFSQDPDAESFDIVIDSDNNSLEGLRDAINNAEKGVTASIIYDGSQYILSVVSESGLNNELEIVASEAGGTPSNNDDNDLSFFSYNADKTVAASTFLDIYDDFEKQAGQDAELTLNGISISRESNTIDDIVEGLKLDVLKVMDANDLVTITIEDDKNFAEQNIRAFVEAYNGFIDATDPIFGVNEVENDDGETETVVGSLANDALAKSILSQIRSVIASSIPGLADSNFSSLTNLGIRTDLDGKLTIDEEDFSRAFDENFEDVQKLLAPHTSSSSEDVLINSFNDATEAGQYELIVTQAPSKGFFHGAAASFPIDTSTKTYGFTITVDGVTSSALQLPDASYDNQDEIAAALQSLINNDSAISDGNKSVVVSYNASDNRYEFTSSSYGSSSNIVFSATSADASELGLSDASGTAGQTAAGTINGVAGFGSANVLLPALGEPGEGLALLIGESASSATLNFSRGFSGELERLIDSLLSSDGVIATRTDTLEQRIESYETDQDDLDRRIGAYEERLLNQFIAMERIISSLNTSGSFLDNLIQTLPFTAQNDN
ncbi:flagellar filament capping protein FliD [Agaribacterium haliotis]|uniref:flagellar filament capping protein FliD n=1 Tax=Agaribacterium haliotis TaxID=2013869 RepID=UPI000BB5301D|nr:flagellar filament capping protein FliD [Agaribacterium haliotis]